MRKFACVGLLALAVLCLIPVPGKAQEPCPDDPSSSPVWELVKTLAALSEGEVRARGYQAVLIDLASQGAEKSLELSVRDALDLERLIYEGLRVENCDLSPIMRTLLTVRQDRPIREGGPLNFIVDLDPLHRMPERTGEFRVIRRILVEDLSERIEEARSPNGTFPPEGDDFWLPPERLPEDYHLLWDRLVGQLHAGTPLLIEIELDGDPTVKSTLEMIAIRSMESVIPYAHWTKNVKNNAEYSCTVLEPWMWKEKRVARLRLDEIKEAVQPEFFTSPREELVHFSNGKVQVRLGSHGDPAKVQGAMQNLLAPMMENHWFQRWNYGSCYQEPFDLKPLDEIKREDVEDFADIVNALSLSPLTGPQNHWFKLLQDLPVSLRQILLTQVARAAVALTVEPSVSPIMAPPELRGGRGNYDRGEVLRRTLTKTIYDLDYPDRDLVIEIIKAAADEAGLSLDEPSTQPEKDLDRWVTVLGRLSNNKVRFSGAPLDGQPIIVSEYADQTVIDGSAFSNPPRLVAAQSADHPVMNVKFFKEGGGGKGMAYPRVLSFLESAGNQVVAANASVMLTHVDTGDLELRTVGFGGASAGAINAGLASSGLDSEKLAQKMREMDFTAFFRDHVPLMGGTGDRRFRGLSRTGLFSTSEMYKTLNGFIKDELGITEPGPVLFKDLPTDLTIVTQLVSRGNLPDDLYNELTRPDGLVVFSKQSTPYADVATAMTASASIPAFFNSPVIHVGRMENGELKEYYFRVSDGGALKNLPADEALTGNPDIDDKALLVMLPVYTKTEDGVGLNTLKFGPTDIETAAVDEYNTKMLTPAIEALGPFLQGAHAAGYRNVVFALDLTEPESRPGGKLVIQGTTREHTLTLHEIAAAAGVPHEDAEEGARIYESNLIPASTAAGSVFQYVMNTYLDGDGQGSESLPAGDCPSAADGRPNRYRPGFIGVDRKYYPPNRLENVDDILKSVAFSGLVSIEERAQGAHLFEKR